MRLIDIVNGPWAVLAETHREIQDIYKRHLKGEKISLKDIGIERRDPLSTLALEVSSYGRNVENRNTYTVVDGVAIIPVHDVIAKRMTWVMEICGGCSSQIFMRDYTEAMNDPHIVGIIPYFDTPGGTVDGTAEAAALMSSLRGNKPVIGFTDGMVCSAGMWMAAPCDELYISSDTNPIGSIGVVAAHVDVSKRMEMFGQRVTEVTAGDFKRITSGYEPLSEEGRAYMQAHLDHIYTAFTDFVAEHRKLDVANHKDWADGKVFLGRQAIDVGLVDGVSTLDNIIDMLATGKPLSATTKTKAVAGVVAAKTTQEGKTMTKEELQAKHPEVYQAVLDEGKQAAETDAETASQESAIEATKSTQENMVALVGAVFGADSGDKFQKVVASGVTADQVSALGGLDAADDGKGADEQSRAGILAGLQAAGNKPLKSTTVDADDDESDFSALVDAYQAENKCKRSEAMRACANQHPEKHAAFIKKANGEKE